MAKVHLKKWKTVDAQTIRQWLPRRDRNAHKGIFGRVLVIGGSVGFSGAPVLAAMAAARTGSGLIYVGVPGEIYPMAAAKLLEPMAFPLASENGAVSTAAIPWLLQKLESMDACLIGCGLGQSEGAFAVVKAVLENAKCPVVVDADGINVLRGHIDVLRGTVCPVILTPHDGEYLRLDGLPVGENRQAAACRLQEKTGATVLLKGHRTLICEENECYVNLCGNPGMATGGSGDVLAGILVSLLGQGLTPVKAAAAAAWLHGTAGDLAARELGEYGLLPSDIIGRLPRLLD